MQRLWVKVTCADLAPLRMKCSARDVTMTMTTCPVSLLYIQFWLVSKARVHGSWPLARLSENSQNAENFESRYTCADLLPLKMKWSVRDVAVTRFAHFVTCRKLREETAREKRTNSTWKSGATPESKTPSTPPSPIRVCDRWQTNAHSLRKFVGHLSSRNWMPPLSLSIVNPTLVLHSVLSFSGSSILNPLRRSTTSSRWRFSGTTTSCRLWAGSWPTGSLITRRTCTSLKTISSLNLRIVSNLRPTTRHFKFQPITRRKATRRHQNRTSMTNNFVLCWLHHCTYRSEEQVQNDHKLITLNEKTWWPVSSSQDPTTGGTGKLVEVFSSQSRLNQDTLPHRDQFSLQHQQGFGSNEPISSFSNPANGRNLFLMETEITCLLKRDLNLWSRNTKLETLNSFF